jgi:hypothetical protein
MQRMKRHVLIFSVTFFLTLSLTYGFLWLRSVESIPGSVSTVLPGRCEIIRFGRGLQTIYKIALACPRMDMIRIWALPVQQPWFEDGWEIGIIHLQSITHSFLLSAGLPILCA